MLLKHSPQTIKVLFFCFFLFAIVSSKKGFSQTDSFFVATKNDSLFFSAEYKQIEDRYKKIVDEIKGDYKKEFKEIYKEQFEGIKYQFTEKKLFTNAKIQEYLKQLVNEIVSNNSELQAAPISIFFSKTEIANAVYVGNNTILFNTGLFHLLQNESQVAFVLCHELSHYFLKHPDSHIEKYVTTVYSKEFQKELKSIKNAEYKKREQLEKLALGLTFNSRKHSRYKESEADSLAIIFMSKTRFDIRESINLLAILDTLDKDNFNAENCLRNNFNSSDYPFSKSWIEKEEGLLGGHANIKEDEKIKDSLKTHPDCKIRIEIVKKILEKCQQNNAQKSFVNPSLFKQLQTQLLLENIAFYIEKKYASTALYHCLKALEKHPNDSYIITTIGSLFNEFYVAQKKHQLNRIAIMPSPDFSTSYNLVLQFIQNLSLDDYKNVGANFLKKYQSKMGQYPAFSKTYHELKN